MIMAVELTTHDTADDLGSEVRIATLMVEMFATVDPAYVAHALGVVMRAKGVVRTTKSSNVTTDSDGKPAVAVYEGCCS